MSNKENKRTMVVGALSVEPLANGKLRMSVGSKQTDIDYKDLWSIMFYLGDDEQKDALMPVKKTPMMVFSRKYVIEAKNDIKKGDKIVFWGEVNVEETVVAAIAKQNGVESIEPQAPELSTVASGLDKSTIK